MKRKTKIKLVDGRVLLAALVIVAFSTVTMGHVASYCGGFEVEGWRWLGYVYAIGGDAAIAVAAFFTRWATTKRSAWTTYFVLVIVEAVFNAAYVEPWARDDWIGAWIYALFPTIIVALLSLLLRQATQLSRGKSAADAIGAALLQRLGVDVARDAEDDAPPAQALASPVIGLREFRALCANPDGNRDALARMLANERGNMAESVNDFVEACGGAPVKESTARGWYRVAREIVEARNSEQGGAGA